jgi:hypothetical protein
VKTILFSTSIVLLYSFAMKSEGPVNVDCSNLNEIIRCASLDTVWASDGALKETVFNREVYQLRYQVLGTKRISEVVTSKSNKKVYHLEAFHHINSPSQSIALSHTLLKQLKVCLDSWELDSTVKQAEGSQKIKDYLFTNSEDETTVRLSVSKKLPKSYTVALEIY